VFGGPYTLDLIDPSAGIVRDSFDLRGPCGTMAFARQGQLLLTSGGGVLDIRTRKWSPLFDRVKDTFALD
jgi:hypothetical protein